MNKVIIFPQGLSIAVVYPGQGDSLEDIASKIVPIDVPYLFVDPSAIPADKTYRQAWKADFSNPHGYGKRPVT